LIKRIGRNGPYNAADPCHKGLACASARVARDVIKLGQNQR
jgi:hypothetical protein